MYTFSVYVTASQLFIDEPYHDSQQTEEQRHLEYTRTLPSHYYKLPRCSNLVTMGLIFYCTCKPHDLQYSGRWLMVQSSSSRRLQEQRSPSRGPNSSDCRYDIYTTTPHSPSSVVFVDCSCSRRTVHVVSLIW